MRKIPSSSWNPPSSRFRRFSCGELDEWLLVQMEFLARCDYEFERLQAAKLRPRLG
jgi:hypothetical protein